MPRHSVCDHDLVAAASSPILHNDVGNSVSNLVGNVVVNVVCIVVDNVVGSKMQRVCAMFFASA